MSERILVTGSRSYSNWQHVRIVLRNAVYGGARQLYVGDARGVDECATEYWKETFGVKPNVFPADWGKHKKAAGPIRNHEMVDKFIADGGGYVYAFWRSMSRGTKDCIDYARRRGLTVEVFEE